MMMSVPSPPVPDEDIKLFHSIDRKLYTKLVIDLGRDPKESMHVMGFWLWLEQDLVKDLTIVHGMLLIPLSSLNEIAKETVFCLRLIELEIIQPQDYDRQLKFFHNLLRTNLTVRYLHDNRVKVRRGVSRIMNEVCYRAFSDIFQKVAERRSTAPPLRFRPIGVATNNGGGSSISSNQFPVGVANNGGGSSIWSHQFPIGVANNGGGKSSHQFPVGVANNGGVPSFPIGIANTGGGPSSNQQFPIGVANTGGGPSSTQQFPNTGGGPSSTQQLRQPAPGF